MFNRSLNRHLSSAAFAASGSGSNVRVAGTNPDAKSWSHKISKETWADLEQIDEANKTLKISGIVIALDIERDFTPNEIKTWPRVDTVTIDADGKKKRDGDKYKPVTGIGGNHLPPDWTSVQDGKRTKWVSYIDGIVLNSAYVKAIDATITDIDDAENKRVGAKKAYTALGAGELEAAKKNAKQTKSRIVGAWRTGVKVIQQRARLAEVFGKQVTFSFYQDGKGNLIPSSDPIILQMTKLPAKFSTFSVTSFNNLDFDEALKTRKSESDVDTWQAILDSLSREDDDEQPKTDPNRIEIDNSDKMYSAMMSQNKWLNDDGNVAIIVKKITSAKSVEDVENILDSVVDLYSNLADLKEKLQPAIEKLANLRQLREGTLKGKALDKAMRTNS